MSPKQIKIWYWVLIGELLFTSFLFLAVSFFAEPLGIDSGGDWGMGRILIAALGFVLGIISVVLLLPFVRMSTQTYKGSQITRYFSQSTIWVLVAVGLCELILQTLARQNPVTAYEQDWRIVPITGSIRFWGTEGYGTTHYLPHGEIATPLDDGAISIVVLGDSHTEALHVSDGDKFVSLAEINIRSQGEDVNLHNLGMSASGIPEYIYLAPMIKQYYNPQVVVIQIGTQDFYGEGGGDGFKTNNRNYFTTNAIGTLDLHHTNQFAKSPLLYNKLISRITIFSLGWERMSKIAEKKNEKMKTDNQISPIQESRSTILPAARLDEQLILLKKAYAGIEIVLLLLPNSPIIVNDTLNFDDSESLKIIIRSAEQVGGFHIINPQVQFDALVEQGHMPRGFINSLPGAGHLNIFGHRIVGELLAEKILEIIQ